jgi:hypothetical protein
MIETKNVITSCGNKSVYTNQAAVDTAISITTTEPAILVPFLAACVTAVNSEEASRILSNF